MRFLYRILFKLSKNVQNRAKCNFLLQSSMASSEIFFSQLTKAKDITWGFVPVCTEIAPTVKKFGGEV